MLLLENFSITGAAAITAVGEPPSFTVTSRFNIAPGKLSVNGVKVQCSAIATAPGSCSVGSGAGIPILNLSYYQRARSSGGCL